MDGLKTCGTISPARDGRGGWRFSLEGATAREVLEQLAAVVDAGGLSARRVRLQCLDGDLWLVTGSLRAPRGEVVAGASGGC